MFSSMMRMYSLLAALLCLLFPVESSAGWLEPYSGPNSSPKLKLPDLQERPHNLKDYRGKVVLVNFWASWCTPCLTEMPSMQRLQQSLADRPFQLLAVNAGETARRAQAIMQRMDLPLQVLLDRNREVFKAWGTKLLPTSYLLDHRGQVRYVAYGPLEWDDEEVIATINALIDSETPEE